MEASLTPPRRGRPKSAFPGFGRVFARLGAQRVELESTVFPSIDDSISTDLNPVHQNHLDPIDSGERAQDETPDSRRVQQDVYHPDPATSSALVLESEILPPAPVAKPGLPAVSPGHEAFAKFLASIDPQFKRGPQDVIRAIEAISLSIEFANGRSISFQSRRSKIAERVDTLSAERNRRSAPAVFSTLGAVVFAIMAVLMVMSVEGLLSFKTAQSSLASAGNQITSTASMRPQIVLENRSAASKQDKDSAATATKDNVAPRPTEVSRARGESSFDVGEVALNGVAHPSSASSVEMASPGPSPETINLDKAQELMREGNVEGAISSLNEAIMINQKSAAAYWRRGLAYAYKNENDKAISDLTRAIEFAKGTPNQLSDVDIFSIHRSRALLYDLKGLYSREVADLTDMINMYWSNPATAEALNQMWTPARAKALIASAHRLRGVAYARISANEKALTDLAFAIELDPQHAAEAYNERGKLREKFGDRTQAIADYRSALSVDPNVKEARKSLARMGFGQ